MAYLAEINANGATVPQAMREYRNAVGGETSYEANGDTWFAMRIDKGGMAYYRKLFVDEADIRWFDVTYLKAEVYNKI
jgi:hypothetical protein